MRALLGTALAAALLALTGCGSDNSNPIQDPLTAKIDTVNNAAAPMGFSFTSPVTVSSRTLVQWRNESTSAHSIVWDDHVPAASPAPGANLGVFGPAIGALSTTWTAPTVATQTTYNYHCGIHGPTMAGQVIVNP